MVGRGTSVLRKPRTESVARRRYDESRVRTGGVHHIENLLHGFVQRLLPLVIVILYKFMRSVFRESLTGDDSPIVSGEHQALLAECFFYDMRATSRVNPDLAAGEVL